MFSIPLQHLSSASLLSIYLYHPALLTRHTSTSEEARRRRTLERTLARQSQPALLWQICWISTRIIRRSLRCAHTVVSDVNPKEARICLRTIQGCGL